MYTRAVFATIFRQMYRRISGREKIEYRPYKWPLLANKEGSENGYGGGIDRVSPVLGNRLRQPQFKFLIFYKFFIFNELPAFLGYIF